MATYVYRVADGSLYSWNPGDDDPVADDDTLKAKGLAKISGLVPLDAGHIWNAAQLTVVGIVPTDVPINIATGKWIMRFTAPEFQAINTSADVNIQQLMYALNHTTEIDLSDPMIRNGVMYLVSINLLTSDRVNTVLAAPT